MRRNIVVKNIVKSNKFISQTDYERRRSRTLKGPEGWLVFYATQSGYERAQAIVNYYNLNMQKEEIRETGEYKQVGLMHLRAGDDEPIIRVHSDGETNPRLPNSVTGANVILFSDPHSKIKDYSVNEDLFRTYQLIYTLKTNGASRVTVVMPYMPYSRAERGTFLQREAAQATLVADFFATAGLDEFLCYHIHVDSVKSFYQSRGIIVHALSGLDYAVESFQDFIGRSDAVVLSPDPGAAKISDLLADKLDLKLAIAGKRRKSDGKSESLGISGDLSNIETALLFDDETVTLNTLKDVIVEANNKYNVKQFYACVSHVKFSDEAYLNLEESIKHGLKKLFITNSIPQDFSRLPEIVEVADLNPLFAHVINRSHYEFSVSELFK